MDGTILSYFVKGLWFAFLEGLAALTANYLLDYYVISVCLLVISLVLLVFGPLIFRKVKARQPNLPHARLLTSNHRAVLVK